MEDQEAEEADLAAAPAAEDLAEAASAADLAPAEALEVRVPVVSAARRVITIIITAPILVGDSVRDVITEAAEDVSVR